MRTVNHIIIAAAGRGKRLGLGLPKCLVPIQGQEVINYQLYLVRNIPYVRIVVGFFEREVIQHIKSIRPDVLFVRNPNFRHTSTLQSLALASKGIMGNCICMDADMIIEESSFERFLQDCRNGKPRIAVAEQITEDPVYTYTSMTDEGMQVQGFGRDIPSPFEWANLAHIPASWLTFENINFFECLSRHKNISASIIQRTEIDTPEDFAHTSSVLKANPAYCHFLKSS